MWFTVARSNTYSPSPARVAPGVRGACCAMAVSSAGRTRSRKGACRGRGAEQRLCTGAQDLGLLARRDREAADLQHAVGHAHVVGIVAAQQHALGAGIVDQELEHLLRMHDGVEVEAIERIGRRLAELAL